MDSLKAKAILLTFFDRKEEAEEFFDKFIEAGGEESDVHYGRAVAYALLQREDEALCSLQTAISLNNDHREQAINDSDLESLTGLEEFQRLIAGDGKEKPLI